MLCMIILVYTVLLAIIQFGSSILCRMQIKLVLCTIALFVYLRGVTSLNYKHQDASLSQHIIAVYISLLSNFNFTWIDDVTARVAPIQHMYSITHLVLTLVDCETAQATLITDNACSATTYYLPFDATECKSEKLNEFFLLTLSLDILYNDTFFWNILSVFGLKHPKYSVLSVVPKESLFLDENKTETILNLIYENFPSKFNAVFFLINESISSHYENYGSPLYEDTYTDGTGFNEAVTTTNIPQTERATSLQYHLLTSGVYTRVCSYQQLDSSHNSLFHLLHHFLTNYFVSSDDFVRLYIDSSECVDTLLCPGYTRTSCEDDILNKLNVKLLDKVNWNISQPFIEFLFENNEPTVLVNTSVLEWPALEKITFENLPSIFLDKEHHNVKNTEFKLTFDPDFEGTKLRLNITLPYRKISLTKDELSHAFTQKSADKGNYLFTKITPSLLQYFSPNEMLFHTYEDWLSSQQFLWVSSRGLATHLHIDMDWNCFVQIRGRKRFTLFPPSQHQLMHMYPRVHPMWHKSKIDIDHFSGKFSNFLITSPLQVVLEPGDLLFIPGYTWHYVESLTPSISLSTWSHDTQLRAHMEAVYNHDHKFDLLFYKQGRVAALCLYIDMLINKLVGVGRTNHFLGRLISNRYHGLESLFKLESTSSLCDPHTIPTAQHIIGYARLDTQIISQHFSSLPPVPRDILLANYIEEISAGVVGPEYTYAFFIHCFNNQSYDVTEGDEYFWTHVYN